MSRRVTMAERLAAHTDTSDPDACWLWGGRIDRDGYGRVSKKLAHRGTYEEVHGPIPEGLPLDHLCRNRRCVNPGHLEPVTPTVNNQRMNASRTHCRAGHPYTPENTLRRGDTRRCRTCNRAACARYAERKRAAA